jgi:hypothetical protein
MSPSVCTPCPAGSFCPQSSPPTLCPVGTFSPPGAASCEPCACASACTVAGLASDTPPSCTATRTPTASRTSSVTPSITPTPSNTPPPFSCLSSPAGCFSPVAGAAAPLGGGGAALPPLPAGAPPVVVSWPAVATPFFVRLPLAPTLGEAATVTCAPADGSGALVVAAAPAQPPCAPPAPACVAVPSTGSGAPVLINFTASAAFNASIPSSSILCALSSTPLATSVSAGLPLPRFGLLTATPPLPAAALRFSLPLLAAVLRESSTALGAFTVAGGGGGGGGAVVALPALDAFAAVCESVAAYAQNYTLGAPSLWASGATLAACPPALAALGAAAEALRASAAAPSLAATLSGARHLLLVASPRTPFPPARSLSVALGGAPCAINWATPALASVTTPPLAALCAGNASAASGDCGLAPLVVAFSPTESDALPLPAAYPPLLPSADAQWDAQLAAAVETPSPATGTPLAAAASLIGLPPALLLASAAALAPPGAGIRVVARCIDPTYAPPELCAVVNYSQPFLNASAGQLCVWGTGDACLPCPPGALCPGGARLLPLPGFWAPAPASPPGDLYPCPTPDAEQRCPGYAAVPAAGGAYGCGAGFRGQVCAACDVGYFRRSGTCAACPPFSAWALLRPLLVFGGALCAAGVALAAAVWGVLRSGGGKRAGVMEAAAPVGSLLAWAWIAAQGLASLFFQAQALAPPQLAPFYAAAAALQFQGIALDPACYSSIPFTTFYAALGVALGCCALAGAALCCLQRLEAPRARRAAAALLRGLALALALGFGALAAEFFSALVCTISAPMTVIDYLQTDNDGAALLAHFPALPRASIATLRAASTNPLAAAASGLTATLQATMPVSVVASDPYKVCNEAAHRAVRPLAALMCVVFTLGLPLLHLAGLRAAGRLKGLRRTQLAQWALRGSGGGRGGSSSGSGGSGSPPPRPFIVAFNEAMDDATLLRRSAWFSAAQKLQLALTTGLSAAARARLPAALYIASHSAIILASALFICVVARARLFTPAEEWRWPVMLLLNVATATAALVNMLLLVLDTRALAPAARAPLAWVPLALAVVTAATLLGAWLRSLRRHTLAVAFLPRAAAAAALAPPQLPPPPPAPAPAQSSPPPQPGVGADERVGFAPRSRRPRRQRTLRRLSARSTGGGGGPPPPGGGVGGGGGGDGEEEGGGERFATRNPLLRAASPLPPAPPPPSSADSFSDGAPFSVKGPGGGGGGGGGGDGEEEGGGERFATRNPLLRAASPLPPAPPPPSSADPFSEGAPFSIEGGAVVIKPHWHPQWRGGGLHAWENGASGARWEGAPPTLPRAPVCAWREGPPRTAEDALFVGARESKARAYIEEGVSGGEGGAPPPLPVEASPLLRAVAAEAAADAPSLLWRRTAAPPFLWLHAATGEVRERDRDLPTGAVTADGWALQRDGTGDRWWYHAGRREALWRGPWAAAEKAARICAARERRRERRSRGGGGITE